MPINSLATNDRNDLFLDPDFNLSMVTDIQAVLQDCEHAMKAQFQEMIYSYNRGLPYFDTVWNQQLFGQFQTTAITTLLRVNGVTSVLSFAVTQVADVLKYNAVIQTIYGAGSFDG